MGWKSYFSPHPLYTRLSMSAARPIGLILLDLITLITFSRRSEDWSIDRRKILLYLIRNSEERCDWIDSVYRQMEDSYKHSNELGFKRRRHSSLGDDLLLIRKAAASWKGMSVLTNTRNWTQSWTSFLITKVTNLIRLDGPGIESRWGRDFEHLSRTVLRHTQPPVQGVLGLSRGLVAAGAWRWPFTPF